MDTRVRLFLVALFVAPLFVGAALAPADAAPPPRPVCAGCGDAFEERAAEFGLDITVTTSTARVVVYENGTATWVVENHFDSPDARARLRANRTLRHEIADARYWDPEVETASLTDDGLRARYRHPGFAAQTGGETLRSTVFSEAYGYGNLHGLGPDRLVVVAPDGMRVDTAVPGATVSSNRSRLTLTSYGRGGFVTFVQRGEALGTLWGWLAIADLVGPVVLLNVALGVVVPTAVGAVVVGATGGVAGRLERLAASTDPAGALTVGGAGMLVLALTSGAFQWFGTATVPLFGVSVATLAGGVVTRLFPRRPTYWYLVAGALAGGVVAIGAAIAGAGLFYGRVPWLGITPDLPLVFGVVSFLPAGFALADGQVRRAALTVAAGVAFATLLTVPLAQPVRIFGFGFRLVATVLQALALAVVAAPFLFVGATFAGPAATDASDEAADQRRKAE